MRNVPSFSLWAIFSIFRAERSLELLTEARKEAEDMLATAVKEGLIPSEYASEYSKSAQKLEAEAVSCLEMNDFDAARAVMLEAGEYLRRTLSQILRISSGPIIDFRTMSHMVENFDARMVKLR